MMNYNTQMSHSWQQSDSYSYHFQPMTQMTQYTQFTPIHLHSQFTQYTQVNNSNQSSQYTTSPQVTQFNQITQLNVNDIYDSPHQTSDSPDHLHLQLNDLEIQELKDLEVNELKDCNNFSHTKEIKENLQDDLITKFFQTKNDYKEFYVIQQGVLLSYLNNYCGFTLKKQKKKAKVTSAYPKLSKLYFDNETIDVQELADKICRPVYKEECVTTKVQTAMRRFEKNKKIFIQHLLIDLLREKGFYFESKLARKSTKTYRLERIEKIYFEGKLLMDFEQFIEKGDAVNSYINSLFDQTSVTIQKGCVDVINTIL